MSTELGKIGIHEFIMIINDQINNQEDKAHSHNRKPTNKCRRNEGRRKSSQ